jgi:hypothetical protein
MGNAGVLLRAYLCARMRGVMGATDGFVIDMTLKTV